MVKILELDPDIHLLLQEGTVIPAHPLALDEHRQLDSVRQQLLTRYYLEAGAGGVAVGVHTTQFGIRDPEHDLFERVLSLAIEEIRRLSPVRPIIKIAGVCGPTDQAIHEASIARDLGYDLGLLSQGGLVEWSEPELLERAMEVGKIIPLFGFYLQPAVGGKILSIEFWRKFAEIPNVYAIKIAPFNRYQTLDVVRAVCLSSRSNEISLYTGNDDHILEDLLTTYTVNTPGGKIKKDIVGGLLGHWAIWTKKAVEILHRIQIIKKNEMDVSPLLLTEGLHITDANAAIFDARNQFKGCIAGIHEVLRRQGLLKGIWCLDPKENLSPGQEQEIDRVYSDYPELNDDGFVRNHLNDWIQNIT